MNPNPTGADFLALSYAQQRKMRVLMLAYEKLRGRTFTQVETTSVRKCMARFRTSARAHPKDLLAGVALDAYRSLFCQEADTS